MTDASPESPAESSDAPRISRLTRVAVVVTLTGLVCVLLFLWRGFAAWSVGVGIFLGIPLLLAGIVIYAVAVVRDLRRRGAI